MASVSGTSSLGNTSLRGYGGFASGIDRDAVIEQMTMGTTTKINNHKSAMETLKWKQEVYQGITEKIVGLTDDYFSYTSSFNMKESSVFARNIITSLGDENVTKFVQATGSSSLVDQLSILSVSKLASSAVRRSNGRLGGSLNTTLKSLDDKARVSTLSGARLTFATVDKDGKATENVVRFTMPSTYKDDDGVTRTIDYTTSDLDKLAQQLNTAVKQSTVKLGNGNKIADILEFKYDGTGNIKLDLKEGDQGMGSYRIQSNSTALAGLGYTATTAESESNGITASDFNAKTNDFKNSYINEQDFLSYLTGKKLNFNYDGTKKDIELITKEEKEKFNTGVWSTLSESDKMEQVEKNVQERLNRAFGKEKVKAVIDPTGALKFDVHNSDSELSVTSSDSALLKNLGLVYGSSNKINLSGTLEDNGLNDLTTNPKYSANGDLNLTINNVKIKGLTTQSTITDIINKINATSEAGVKASYVSSTGQFMLVSTETGTGRKIELGDDLAKEIFENGLVNSSTNTTGAETFTDIDGTDAVIKVGYGNGTKIDLTRSTNTFDLEGLKVTVSGTFNGETDSSKVVTFSAKADVDGVTEKMTKFFEAYNELTTEINKQLTTRADKSYGPLTDEQKAEMTETSIENWEKKAKQGLLFGDSILRDLSMDVQNVLLNVISNGGKFDDLEEIGITISDDPYSGGTISFNESAFKDAMTNNPEKVSNLIAGGGDVKKGLAQIIEETFTPYATRYSYKNGGSYGRLVEEAGSEKMPLSVTDNYIYKQLKDMEETLTKLQARLTTEQDRYISQFTTMETLISQMNSQSGWLSQLQS